MPGAFTSNFVDRIPPKRQSALSFLTRVGPIALDCEALVTADGQQLVVLTPPAGTSSMDKLRLLAVVGRQSVERQCVDRQPERAREAEDIS